MAEEKAVAVLMANLKGSKIKASNWLEIAKACRSLRKHQKWGIKKMSDYFEVSEYQLRQIDTINDLNPDVKDLVKQGKFGVEECYQLWRLGKNRQSEAAKAVLGMTAHEVRQFVQLLKNNAKLSVAEARRMTAGTSERKVRILMLPLTSQTFSRLEEARNKSKVKNIHDFVLDILERFLDAQRS